MSLQFHAKWLGALSLLAALAGCGGGGANGPDIILPIGDGQPEAYTTTYLSQHPEMLVQPEHLIVARLDGSDTSARLYVRQPTQVSVDTAQDADALAGIDIVDDLGHTWLQHSHGAGPVQVRLAPGKYRVVFHAAPPTSGATPAQRHLAYLKLADTPTQAQARRQRDQSSLQLAASTGQPAYLRQQALGLGTSDSCIACSFNGANLGGHDFSGQDLQQSTFVGANLTDADFSGVDCRFCVLTGLHVVNARYMGFDEADLNGATLQGYFSKVAFRGAALQSATVQSSEFSACDFGPAPDGTPTTLRNADLSTAYFLNWGDDNNGIRQADFSGAKGRPGMFGRQNLAGDANKMAGASFANMTPDNIFVGFNFSGMDLSGTDFTGQDLSHADFSKANGVILTADTNFWGAILSDGTTGIKLGGHDFGTGFKKFAGSSDGTTPGKDLRHVDFTGVNLFQADLTSVRLDGATLIGADLAQTSLYKASLVGAQLGATPDNGTSPAANLSGAYMAEANLTDADVRSVKFDNAHLYGGVKFLRARADSASMNNTILADADFTQASLSDAMFSNAILVNANFGGANLLNAEMYNAYLQGANFVDTLGVSGANLTDAYVSTDSGSWSFKEADGTPYVYGYNATALGDLASSQRGVATCPDGEPGPCTGAKLQPTKAVPYPPPPPCIPKTPDDCLPPHP